MAINAPSHLLTNPTGRQIVVAPPNKARSDRPMTHSLQTRAVLISTLAIALTALSLTAGGPAQTRDGKPRVEVLLSTDKTILGQKIVYPRGAQAQVTAAIVTLEPGQTTVWHTHPVPVFGMMLEGRLTVDYGAHGKRVYKKGDALAEAMKQAHQGRNEGVGRVRILVVFLGAKGVANSKPAPAPKRP
jgi:quercetin dioxygenase-like cupin family protein